MSTDIVDDLHAAEDRIGVVEHALNALLDGYKRAVQAGTLAVEGFAAAAIQAEGVLADRYERRRNTLGGVHMNPISGTPTLAQRALQVHAEAELNAAMAARQAAASRVTAHRQRLAYVLEVDLGDEEPESTTVGCDATEWIVDGLRFLVVDDGESGPYINYRGRAAATPRAIRESGAYGADRYRNIRNLADLGRLIATSQECAP